MSDIESVPRVDAPIEVVEPRSYFWEADAASAAYHAADELGLIAKYATDEASL